MDKFFRVMEGPIGRVFRVLLGAVLVYLGLARMSGAAGPILAVAGVLPIVMGLWGPCLLRLALRGVGRA